MRASSFDVHQHSAPPRLSSRGELATATGINPPRGRREASPRSTTPTPQYAARVATVSERIGGGRFVSFELWPPRSAESASALEAALGELAGLGAGVVAGTLGARGPAPGRAP